uniref:Cytokine receptor family member B16 n=1 Tax=Oryzias latipes TaxID=8090 RepID=A0A3B3I0W7_ORYLA
MHVRLRSGCKSIQTELFFFYLLCAVAQKSNEYFSCMPADIWTLPAPSRVFVDSVNMRHILRWRPPQAACNTTVLFSVQFQGEFELLVKNGTWMDVFDCQQIPFAHCDLSFEVGSDSDYDLQVRAQCGSEVSNWTKLGSPFNRRNTQLTVPEMKVKTAGDTLQVLMEEFPLSKVEYSLTPEQPMLHIEGLHEGKVYCVRAQLMLYSGVRSSSTRPHCVLLWWTFLLSAWQLHAPSKLATSVALCCVIQLKISEWPFIVASLRHTCAIIMLSNQHLDMAHL